MSVSEQDFSKDRLLYDAYAVKTVLDVCVIWSDWVPCKWTVTPESHTNLDLSNIKSFFKYRISYVSKRLILHFNVNLDWDSNYGYVIPVQGNIEV